MYIDETLHVIENNVCETLYPFYNGTTKLPSIDMFGTYTYIGRLKEDKSPIYEWDGGAIPHYIIKEWNTKHAGYTGWKVVVRF